MTYEKTILFIEQQKGGSGKTTVADFLNATCTAAGKATIVIDVDDGNSGFLRRCGEGSALSLSWMQPPETARKWIDQNLTGMDVVLFDLGANLFASNASVTRFLAEVATELQKTNARIIFCPVASTNSPGVGRLVTEMRDNFSALGEVRVVENNVDGSGEFPRELNTLGIPRIQLDHIDPGLQAARLLKIAPLLKTLENPPTGYEMAMALYSRKVLEFAKQPLVLDIAGEKALPRLAGAAERANGKYAIVSTLERADNHSIEARCAAVTAYSRLCRVDRSDREAVYQAAIAYLEKRDA